MIVEQDGSSRQGEEFMPELGPEGSGELLVRVVLWAPAAECIGLYEHLYRTNHPFVYFVDKPLARYFRLFKKGWFFELFTLPVNMRVLWKELQILEEQGLVTAKFELFDLPMLLIRRAPSRRPPTDPLLGLDAVLSLLPAWIVENEIDAQAKARKKKRPKKRSGGPKKNASRKS